MNVGLRQLRVFFAVTRTGSFSRAAQEVGLSQSAVSISVRQLEAELGLRLLDRTTRQVQLTAIGAILAASGARIVDELDATLRELRDIGVQHGGRVKMACVPAVARSLMPGCIAHCLAKWPNISFSVDDSAATDVIRKVRRGEVEFGVASGDVGGEDLHLDALMEDPFCLVCRRDDAMAASASLPWAQVAGRRLIMLGNTSGSRRLIETTLERTGTSVDVILEMAQPSSVLGMVEGGIGIAIVPRLAAPRPDDPVLATCSLVNPAVTRTIVLLRRRDRSLSPAAAAVWSALLDLHSGGQVPEPIRPVSGQARRQAAKRARTSGSISV